jgi:tRNA(Ile)-lysidine synthase
MDRLRPGWAGELGVVAVSGGADSVALLRGLVECGAKVVVGHLNHQLRGDEGDADEAFVVELAGTLGVPVRTHRVNVAALSGNVEATARRVRYEWLRTLANEVSAGWIATGHSADDQAETVLHRLIRGTGLQGLRGVAAIRGFPRGGEERATRPLVSASRQTVVRPLLTIPRTDLLEYLQSLLQPYRTDSTNADTAFTRNRIRAELLPLLSTYNPGIVDVLNRLSVQAEELFAEQEAETAVLVRSVELPRAGGMLILNAEKLTALGEAKTRNVLRMLWDRESWPVNAMTFEHWRRAAKIATGEHSAADFPDGVHVRRAGKVVQLGRVR